MDRRTAAQVEQRGSARPAGRDLQLIAAAEERTDLPGRSIRVRGDDLGHMALASAYLDQEPLFAITALKLLAAQLGIAKIQAGAESGSITFAERSRVDPTRLLQLIQSDSARYRLDGPYKLRFSWALENPDKRIAGLEKLLRRLGAEDQAAAAA